MGFYLHDHELFKADLPLLFQYKSFVRTKLAQMNVEPIDVLYKVYIAEAT